MNDPKTSTNPPHSGGSGASGASGGSGGLQGWIPELADPKDLVAALDRAFDYRGDVTVTLRDGRVIDGYIFDRRPGQGLHDSTVRMMPRDADGKINIPYAEIARLQFSDRDPAVGKTWETWVKKYVEKKLKGEHAEIRAESLED